MTKKLDQLSDNVSQSQFAALALADKDVKFGFDNYEILKQLGSFVREMRVEGGLSQVALQEISGVRQADISRVESGTMERGPSVLTLVRLAHAAGKRLVIGIEDEQGEGKKITRVLAV